MLRRQERFEALSFFWSQHDGTTTSISVVPGRGFGSKLMTIQRRTTERSASSTKAGKLRSGRASLKAKFAFERTIGA